MKRFRLTKASKILILVMILALIGGGGYFGFSKGFIKTKSKNESVTADKKTNTNVEAAKHIDASDSTINLALDEWIGWKSIIDANGGLKTQKNSIFDKLGLKVNINVVNDAAQSSNAMIKGKLNAAGYTINRTAFLSKKFTDAGLDVVMPYITNYSNGGDGIIATDKFQTVNSLVDAKIGVPQFSEAHSLVVWFVNQSDLTDDEKQKIINDLIFFDTPDDAAKAFFAGQIDVAATWQPYLTQAENTSNCHVLFSTANSTKLILDGIVFRSDFAKAHPEVISKFIDGALQASAMYDTEFDALKQTMPMFSGMSDDEIKSMTADAALAGWTNNMETLSTEAPQIYSDMCNVWSSIGESVNPDLVDELFDTSYMENLQDKYEGDDPIQAVKKEIKVTEENQDEILNVQAMLTKSASVNFIESTAKFVDSADASAKLDDFIKVAKILDGTIIQIEGNTDPNPDTDPTDEANVMLSKQRAETVKQYFILNGISADRIISVGNGSSNPIVDNTSDENRAMNRRTDVSFKCIE